MTTEALPQLSCPRLALRPVGPQDGVSPAGVRLEQFPITVGAGATCKIRLTTPGARPLHCLLVETQRGVAVRRWAADTRLNGESFTESLLAVGDQIACGDVEFEVVEASDEFNDDMRPAETAAPTSPVTWPLSGNVWDSAGPVGQGRSAAPHAEPASLEQASEALRLAGHCQRLEDELAETRSLLTSLSEELLQARELAAHQATKLTNRIDELEGDLAERDNLLVLLQEALEQRPESFDLEPGVDTTTGFETELTTSTETSAVPAEPESVESSWEYVEAWEQSSTPSEKEAGDDLAGESLSQADETPPVDTSECEERLESTPLPIEHEASAWPSTSPAELGPSDHPSFPAPTLSGEDLWDIEKVSSESEETSLWEDGTAPEAPAPTDTSVPLGDPAPGPNVSVPSEAPGSDQDALNPPPTTGEALDPWGSDSLWSTSSLSDECDTSDQGEAESALLWGQSPSPTPKTEPRSLQLKNSGMVPDPAPREATEEAAPFTSPSTETPVAEVPTLEAGTLEPQVADDQVAGRVDDDVHSSAEAGTGGLIADTQPQPKAAAPVSFIEQYRHLLDDDGEDISATSVEPTPVVSLAPAPLATQGDTEDDTIEAYMAKMMARLRGESMTSTPASQAPARPQAVAPPTAASPTPEPNPSPLLSLDEVKTAAIPERHTNMSALRDLANNSARHAIGMANSRRLIKQARSNLLLTLAAMSAGGYLVWSAPSTTSEQMVAGLIAVGGAALWGCRTLAFMTKARRESRGEIAREAEATPSAAENLLPIDVAPPQVTAPPQV